MTTLALKTALQAFIYTNFLVPQIAGEDGFWANAKPEGHGAVWAKAKVVVDETNPGVDFEATKNNYDFTNKDLVDDFVDGWLAAIEKAGHGTLTKSKLRHELQVIRQTVKVTRGEAGSTPAPVEVEAPTETIAIPAEDELRAMSNSALVSAYNDLAPKRGVDPLSASWAKRSKDVIVEKFLELAA